ncbi:hypothetical protein LCGC14_1330050 [marine sediment metagenome]|uniref:Uncharacterized protein n=1 Tax=marine sediment metagenome TaxID=412755 RepID=A0A0F9NJC5_9ZZZZ
MANAILFYRTPTTRIADVADPQNLPTGQKLEFTFPDDIMEGINEDYRNNIKQIPIPNQDGVRKLNIQENGLNTYTLTLNGVFKKTAGVGIADLKVMRILKQVDTTHIFGIFGIEIDNAPEFNLDPDGTKGFHIISTTTGYAGVKTTRYDFSVTLGFGGTVT